jgi:AcrR family transcriptional regulator
MSKKEAHTPTQVATIPQKPESPPLTKNAQSAIEQKRRQQLIQIAFDLIASKGFEGLRFQEVAAIAGINNATLYYYYPSKEALIEGVVHSMMEQLKTPPPAPNRSTLSALDELRQVFASARIRLSQDPSFFIVITELALRSRRDPAINNIGEQRDRFWERDLTGILERGVSQGIFRRDLDSAAVATSLMAQLKGVAHHAAMRDRKQGEIDAILSQIAAQVEHWLTCVVVQPSSRKKTSPRRPHGSHPIQT